MMDLLELYMDKTGHHKSKEPSEQIEPNMNLR